jgi:hypothetical protein
MKITKEGQELVLRVPLRQPSYDAVGEYQGDTDNLIGISTDREWTISYLNDLGYKGTQQEGAPIINFYSRKELEKACKELGINIWDYDSCVKCKKPLRGSYKWTSKGVECMDHDYEKSN